MGRLHTGPGRLTAKEADMDNETLTPEQLHAAAELEFANTYDEEHSRYMVKVKVFDEEGAYFGPTLGQAIANAKAAHEADAEQSGLVTDSVMKGHGGYRVFMPNNQKKSWVRVKNEDPDAGGYNTLLMEALSDLGKGNTDAAINSIIFVSNGLAGIEQCPDEWCTRQIRIAAGWKSYQDTVAAEMGVDK